MDFHFVYVLKSQIDGTTYIGSTDKLEKRLREHSAGKTKSIRHKVPYDLCYYEAFSSKWLARKRRDCTKEKRLAEGKAF